MKTSLYNTFDIIRIPFPFSDLPSITKERPALVLSSAEYFGNESSHSVVAMITSANKSTFPLDTPVSDYEIAGLPKKCIVRMKFFTIDHRIIREKVGKLSNTDQENVTNALQQLFPFL